MRATLAIALVAFIVRPFDTPSPRVVERQPFDALRVAPSVVEEQLTPQTQRPVFRGGTRLVQINVVVHDKHGQPVTDLKKEDFTLLERGKPQPISFFSMDTSAVTSTSAASAVASASSPAPPLESRTFTNTLAEHGDVPGNVTAVLIDTLNSSVGEQMRARDGLIKFLSQIEPRDRIAIFVITSHGLALLHDYTTDAASLVERVRSAKPQIPTDLDASLGDPAMQKELRDMGLGDFADVDQRTAEFFMADRIKKTLVAFEAIARHLEGLPGRKNLVWLSSGIPLSIGFDEVPEPGKLSPNAQLFDQDMESAVRLLNNAGIAVYPVDARGVFNPVVVDSSVRVPTGKFGQMASVGSTSNATSTMFILAERTGGRMAYNTNDLGSAIRRAIDDARVTYTLGYYPADASQDGKFREIKVSVNRSGLDVRARKGYFATRPVQQDADSRAREIRGAVWSPIDSTALPMTAHVAFTGEDSNTVEVRIELDANAVAFSRQNDRWKAELDTVVVQKNVHGALQGDGKMDRLAIALTDENYKRVSEDGLIHLVRTPRHPSASSLRIVVRDAVTGSIGSVTVPFGQVAGGGLVP